MPTDRTLTDERLDAALRSLDPAGDPADPHGPRARADLARAFRSPGPRRPRAPRRRLAIAGAAVAATVAGAAAVPTLTSTPAFASWTPTPTGLSGEQRAEVADACHDALAGTGATVPATTPAVAERRGRWTLVVLTGAERFQGLCVTGAGLVLDDWFGSSGTATGPEPGPRGLRATDLGSGTASAGDLSVAVGLAGADVTGVRYDSAARGPVEATVSGGRFALWFPGDELAAASSAGVPVTATYADGSTAEVVLDLR